MLTKQDYQNFKDFLLKYEELYDKKMIKFIKDNFKSGMHSSEIVDILKQVYAYLGILPEEQNIYKKCLDIIKEEYGLEQNILEIGAGAIPIFSMYVDEEQKNGSITAYDKYLVPNKLGNIKIYKKNFTMNDSTKDYNLVVGIYPCDASYMLIQKAAEENKDMLLLSCDCTHFSTGYLQFNMPDIDEWHDYLYYRACTKYENKKEIVRKKIMCGELPKTLIYTKRK